jgi:carboxymethylenebutenolidase
VTHNGSMLELTSGDGAKIGCYQVTAKGKRKGGLVLVQEAFGVTNHIKQQGDAYAERGYDVLSPQLYDREEKNFAATPAYTQQDKQKAIDLRAKTTYEKTVLDAQMCIDKLHADGNTKVFIVGYCYGGSVAWLAACRCNGLTAASCYYGSAIKDFINEKPKCPTICHFGAKDTGIPLDSVRAIQKAHPEVTVYIYDAGHGFNSDRPAMHDQASADLALKRTLELFDSI